MDLSPTHVHLLLNHFPTVGFLIAAALFLSSLVTRSHHLRIAGLTVIVGIALLTIPTFVTGNAAEDRLCRDVGPAEPCQAGTVPRSLVHMHEGAAFVALLFMQLAGGVAWLGLWQIRTFGAMRGWTSATVAFVAMLTFATMARAASLGGEIRHPEIRVTMQSADLQIGRAVGNLVRDTPWIWIALETLHFIGLTLLIGVMVLAALKAFGVLPSVSVSAVERLLPWAILGYGVNAVTGMMFFLATPIGQGGYTRNLAFYWKLVFLSLAAGTMLLMTLDQSWKREGHTATLLSRALVGSALVLWGGVLFWGSMLPFIGNAF